MRLQLALNVKNLDRAIDYYSRLFGAAPHKVRPGYANFALDEPPLKLVLLENAEAAERINHLGVEVAEEEQLQTAARRLETQGIAGRVEQNVVCCHAEQRKVWSTEPDGLEWEWYRITDDAPAETRAAECSRPNADARGECC
jgi:catechol 2,3-dioxygenase-like lactoylglutathione lyase family enzyme